MDKNNIGLSKLQGQAESNFAQTAVQVQAESFRYRQSQVFHNSPQSTDNVLAAGILRKKWTHMGPYGPIWTHMDPYGPP